MAKAIYLETEEEFFLRLKADCRALDRGERLGAIDINSFQDIEDYRAFCRQEGKASSAFNLKRKIKVNRQL